MSMNENIEYRKGCISDAMGARIHTQTHTQICINYTIYISAYKYT